MLRWGPLLLLFFGCLTLLAQTPAPPSSKPIAPSITEGTVEALPAAQRSLDAARRTTESALHDASNLLPLERDFLLVRLASMWNTVDHKRAEEYLTTALERLRPDLEASDNSQSWDLSGAIMNVSSDVLEVDRKAWDRLIRDLPASAASEAISTEAQNRSTAHDVTGAMELEQKSLQNGGSENDAGVLHSLIHSDLASASALFDQILSTAEKTNSDSNLLTMTTQYAFSQDHDPETQSFFDHDRQQRMLDLLAQRTLTGKDHGACDYAFETARVFSRFPPALQGQLQPVISECQKNAPAGSAAYEDNKELSTDEIVHAMNEASDAKTKRLLRQRAIRQASEKDRDNERAVHLCLDVTDQERKVVNMESSFDAFDNCAINNASVAVQVAIHKGDDLEFQRVLGALPARLKSQVELISARMLEKKDEPQALLMLSDARRNLEQEVPFRTISYLWLLNETARLVPQDTSVAWRILGTGLNRFDQKTQATSQSKLLSTGLKQVVHLNPIEPYGIPAKAVEDEGLVRAVVDDISSAESRASLRLGVIAAFIERYKEDLKEAPNRAATTPKKD